MRGQEDKISLGNDDKGDEDKDLIDRISIR
jgi:hypothetical protein